jgi:hypothetical protein
MKDYNRQAKRRASELASEAADQYEATILHNRVYDTVDRQHHENHLLRTLHLSECAYELSDDAETDHLDSAAFGAAEQLNATVDDLVEERIAKVCADVILDGDAWTDAWEMSEIDAAQAEAREWLGDHLDAAERADVLETVREKAAEEW